LKQRGPAIPPVPERVVTGRGATQMHHARCEEFAMNDRQLPTAIRRAFSLIELLVVILIIALVIAIAIPSLNGARNSARNAGTRALMTQITQAAAQFERDERRMPGYFDAREMGHAENADRGFTAMHNIMLDLAGGIVTSGGVEVGPMASRLVRVDPKLIGATGNGGKMYFVPDRKFFIEQNEQGQLETSVDAHRQLPSVIDSFGGPLMVWVMNEMATGPVTLPEHFARLATPTGNNVQQPRFSWNSNAGFLRATGAGRRSIDQTNPETGSLLGPGASAQDRERSMLGVLGHPSFPYRATGSNMPPSVPAQGRGSIVVHSAGSDGVFFGRRDRGARQFAGGFIDYRLNFAPDPQSAVGGTNVYTDKDGKPTNIDVTAKFDDALVVGGN
jgi:prepilin-type N-terminal cleavage/methylation domain-containing protein